MDGDQESGFDVDSRENVSIACENTEKISLRGRPPGGENFRRVVSQFTKDGTKYTALLTFRFVDGVTSDDLLQSYDLVLKTIQFN